MEYDEAIIHVTEELQVAYKNERMICPYFLGHRNIDPNTFMKHIAPIDTGNKKKQGSNCMWNHILRFKGHQMLDACRLNPKHRHLRKEFYPILPESEVCFVCVSLCHACSSVFDRMLNKLHCLSVMLAHLYLIECLRC